MARSGHAKSCLAVSEMELLENTFEISQDLQPEESPLRAQNGVSQGFLTAEFVPYSCMKLLSMKLEPFRRQFT